MSLAASLPGQNFSQTTFFVEQTTCPGQLRCLGQNFLLKTDFQEFWDSCAQYKTSEISKNGPSGILGLLCADQGVRNLKKCTFRNSGTPVRRTKRRKSRALHCQEGILGLLCAEPDVGNLKKCTSKNSGTPVRRTRRQKSQKNHVQKLWDSCAQHKTSEISKKTLSRVFV